MVSRRILHVVDHLVPASGVASVVISLIEGVRDFTHDVAVYGMCDPSIGQKIINQGGNVYKLPGITSKFGILFAREFIILLQNVPYRIVHGHLLNSAFVYMRIAKWLKVPGRIIHVHSTLGADTHFKRIRNKVLTCGITKLANCNVAVSVDAAKYAFGKKHSHVVSNGISTSRFRYNPDVRQEIREELGVRKDVLCVGNVARFTKLKNHTFLLDVFMKMCMQSNCILMLVGEGPQEVEIMNLVSAMGLSDYVKFLGARNDVERLYQAFDVFLLPSLAEGFGLAALEAQCAGLGCVVSDQTPITVGCSNRIKFISLNDTGTWAETALSMAKLQRIDGSKSVRDAKLDDKTMCDEILKIYQE